jgi:hypothetical protein
VYAPYIPGSSPPPDLPLERFLPPIPGGMVKTWCHDNLRPGEWVLEPFGFSPLTAIEVASAGNPILVCVNNPIHAFLLRIIASAPQEEELVSALHDLAIASKGDERMEPYIRGLYHITCANCHRQIEAEAFLWKKDADQPYAAQIDCIYCAARGEQPLTVEALQSLSNLPPKQLHMARALNRIAEQDDALRAQVENALNAYPTRPLIILQTLINKLQGLEQTPRRRALLTALILSAADHGNTLWAYPSPRNRPRQIVVPSVYRERNLWKVMEDAVATWQVLPAPIPLSDWQGVPDHADGIYLFQGRIRELTPVPTKDFFSAVIASIPRPNQAFWTLSALWTGWIWGLEAVAPIRQVLSRQRYDWNWHTNALMSVFNAIRQIEHPGLKFWGLIAENEPMLLLASLLAANAEGFELAAYAQSMDDQLGQCRWQASPKLTGSQPEPTLSLAQDAVVAYLQKKAEPASYQQVHAAAITTLAHNAQLAIDIFLQNVNQATSETQKWIETLFQDTRLLTQLAESKASLETGEWWLTHPKGVEMPLIDRLEDCIYQHLVASPNTTGEVVKNITYQSFPGILTPGADLILNCLASYADLVDPQAHLWSLRASEQPTARKADKQAMINSLNHIAQRLSYRVVGEEPLYWHDEQEAVPKYCFYILTSAIVSPYLVGESRPGQKNILVLPGSRANLLAFKRQRDPILQKRLDRDFLVVKFRLVRDLEVNPLLSRDLFIDLIHADPPEYRTSQLALL